MLDSIPGITVAARLMRPGPELLVVLRELSTCLLERARFLVVCLFWVVGRVAVLRVVVPERCVFVADLETVCAAALVRCVVARFIVFAVVRGLTLVLFRLEIF